MISFRNLFVPTQRKRLFFFLLVDVTIFVLSPYLSLLFRFDFNPPEKYLSAFFYWLPFFVIFKISLFYFLRLYHVPWRYVGINEFFKEIMGLLGFTLFAFSLDIILQKVNLSLSLPRSVIIMDFFISVFLCSAFRISKRLYLEFRTSNSRGIRVLIVGAGDTGERILRGIKNDPRYLPIGFLDRDPLKIGTYIHGIPVLGCVEDLKKVIREGEVDIAVIAIPSLGKQELRKLYDYLREAGVKEIKIVPSLRQLPEDIIMVKDLRDLSVEDLLGREPVDIKETEIANFLKGKRILITGAGGSIGSEIAKQVLNFCPKVLGAFELDETDLYQLYLELKDKADKRGVEFQPLVGDVRDEDKVRHIFLEFRPEIVFHAAAYKHVPIMESFPEEALKTNVLGTYYVAKAAIEAGVVKFVNISTDKAVNPANVMGATKRIAEMICGALNQIGKTKFISVRFGNVLGSRGSVLPIFLEQIKRGGPVTVTHPEMERYFMTIPEAVLLVLQAAAMGQGGEIFILDMGKPIKILKLAEELIRFQGLEPYKDVDIVFTGLRPGEKLREELCYSYEKVAKTRHRKIWLVENEPYFSLQELEEFFQTLKSALNRGKAEEFLKKFLSRNSKTKGK